MNHTASARAARGVSRLVLGGLAVVIALAIGTLGHPSLSSSGTSVLDGSSPSVANLDPDLRDALREAAADARQEGVEIHVNSGWRSPAEQERLLREAISTYGSREAAARWVATPRTSPHVSGDAVDLGPTGAAAWLSAHGARHGLCQIYDNEPWHYELRPEAVDQGCPPTYADPTRDPRMHP